MPLVAALLSGVAGQPQSYFYLLPAVLVSASAWAIDPRQQVRRVGAILFVVGLVVLGWAQAKRPPEDHGYVPLAEAFARLPTRDILAAPLFLEVPLDVYSRQAETEKLRDILKQGRLDGVMFVCSETDPRANFDNYVMFDDDTWYEVTLPETSFQEFHQHGTLRLLGLTGGQHLYPRGEKEWEVVHGHAGMRLSGAAFGALPSLGVMSSADDFIALEATEFSVPQWAIVTAVFARRGASAVATLCANVEGEWQPQVAYRGQVLHLMAADSTDLIWSLETRMVLAQPDQRYAACITGEGAGERYVADLIYTYFPLE